MPKTTGIVVLHACMVAKRKDAPDRQLGAANTHGCTNLGGLVLLPGGSPQLLLLLFDFHQFRLDRADLSRVAYTRWDGETERGYWRKKGKSKK